MAPDDPREQLRIIIRYFLGQDHVSRFPRLRDEQHRGRVPRARPSGSAGAGGMQAREPGAHPGDCRGALPAKDPRRWPDGLVLIIEGAMTSHHIFGSQGPSAAMTATADALIEASL